MKVACSLLSSGKYLLDPELRARQVVHVARNSDIQFCKSFWSLLENDLSSHLPLLSGFMVQVNAIITLPPVTFELPARDPSKEKTVKVSPPSVYTGATSVQFRLISSEYREGQEILLKNLSILRLSAKNQPLSRSLLFHIHGGGFVSQSSKSHEVYLRQWARDLKVPVISVDYSLAPENPFPRALEECFYVLVPSPSRLLSVMDPLLPVGVMLKCLDAYIGTATVSYNYGQREENHEDEPIEESPNTAQLTVNPEFSSCPATPLTDNERLHLEAKDLENNIIQPPNTFLPSDIGDLFGTSKSQTPSEKSDYSTPQGLSPVKVTNNQVSLSDQEDEDGWEDICNIVIPQTMPLVESEDIVFSQFSDQTPSSAAVDSYSSVRQQLFKTSPDSGISLNDSRSRNCDKNFVSEPNLDLDSSSGLPSSPNPISHSISTPAFHIRRPENVNIRRPHLTSFEPQNVQLALERFLKLPVIKNPLVSPIFASDEQLRMFPEISLVTCHFDPLLDDSVQLCKRMRQLGKTADLTVLEDLPHGFLNFALISKEARQGSNVCVSKLRKLLQVS
ncbi:LIPE [Acanthosepion pharaonis]|uniref:Hormone-sensitive lipase n=1 Tax=Acanthosepion pharaonis TaxID=158019 RepID=A0A812BY05_ACAPH|nr:LIPE [Sepia pharaonis]